MTNKDTILRVGDTVLWRGCFGTDQPYQAKVTGILVGDGKYGDPAPAVPWRQVRFGGPGGNGRDVVVDLDTRQRGHLADEHSTAWAYGYQIEPVS